MFTAFFAALGVACSDANELGDGGPADAGAPDSGSCEADSGGNPYITALRGDAGAFLVGAGYAMPSSVALHEGRVYWTAFGLREEGIYSALPNGCDLRQDYSVSTPRFLKFSGDRMTWLSQEQAAIYTASPVGAPPVRLGQAAQFANIGVVGPRVYGMGGECNLVSYDLNSGDRIDHGPNLPTLQGGYLVAGEQTVAFSCRGIGAVYAYDVATSSVSTIVRSDFEYLGVAIQGDEILYAETTCTDLRAACPGFFRPGCCPARIVAFNRATRQRREVLADADGPMSTIAFAPDGSLYYSGNSGVKRRRLGSTTIELFGQEAIVDQFAFADSYVYWGNTMLLTDTTAGRGYVIRLPW